MNTHPCNISSLYGSCDPAACRLFASHQNKNMMQNKMNEVQVLDFMKKAGLKPSRVIDSLESQVKASKENFELLSGMMNHRTRLTEKIKVLELELFTRLLKKQLQ